MKIKFNIPLFLFMCFLLPFENMNAQGTWTANPQQAPLKSGGLMLLMSDGSVLCKSSEGKGDGFGNTWFKLKPDINGSYLNGSWSIVAPMKDSRLYLSSQVLKNGQLYVAGGEYGSGIGSAELYDSQSNSWTDIPAGNGHIFADANSAILDNGTILQADLASTGKRTYLYNPYTNSYSVGPNCLAGHDEATWIKLPDNSIFFVNFAGTGTERYIPALNQWTVDAPTPVTLYDNYVRETGPSMLLPNGKMICFGSTGNTAIYSPSGNVSQGSWQVGPSLPAGKGCPDTQAAMQVDGKILLTASNAVTATATAFDPPTYFYEFDYLTNSYTAMQAPGGGLTANDSAFNFTMLNLPDGSIILSQVNNKTYYFHKAIGAPLAIGVPTISNVTQQGCNNLFTATGLLFNGISEGASYGDDWQMNTNFPLIRLKLGTNVYYAKTFNWNHTGVQRFNEIDSTQFTLPANLPFGTYSLSVVANGIASAPYTFNYYPYPTMSSNLNLPTICSGNTLTYQAVYSPTNSSVQWTRASVTGIANPAITSPQNTNPTETFTNTSKVPRTVVYAYTITTGPCAAFYSVNCVVSSGPSLTILGNTLICPGDQNTLTAGGADTYTWNTGITGYSITASPSVNTIYQVMADDIFGCSAMSQYSVNMKPSANFVINGNTNICLGDTVKLSVAGSVSQFSWSTGNTKSFILVSPLVNTVYSVICNGGGACAKSDSIKVFVSVCTSIQENEIQDGLRVFPNPVIDIISIEQANMQTTEGEIILCDVFGNTLYKSNLKLSKTNPRQSINMSEWPEGVYVLQIFERTKHLTFKIIKQ